MERNQNHCALVADRLDRGVDRIHLVLPVRPPVSTALVVGLGRSGEAAAALLVRRGWRVIAVDAHPVDAAELVAIGVDVRGAYTEPVPGVDLVVKSPGVPTEVAQVAAARAGGAEVISEIELAARELANPIIGITGTNGKTTTT